MILRGHHIGQGEDKYRGTVVEAKCSGASRGKERLAQKVTVESWRLTGHHGVKNGVRRDRGSDS